MPSVSLLISTPHALCAVVSNDKTANCSCAHDPSTSREALTKRDCFIIKLEMCPVGTRMPRQGVMSVTQNDFREMIYR